MGEDQAALQSVQTAATLAEQRQQAIIDKLQAEAGQGGMGQVNFYVTSTADPHAIAEEALWKLHLAGL